MDTKVFKASGCWPFPSSGYRPEGGSDDDLAFQWPEDLDVLFDLIDPDGATIGHLPGWALRQVVDPALTDSLSARHMPKSHRAAVNLAFIIIVEKHHANPDASIETVSPPIGTVIFRFND